MTTGPELTPREKLEQAAWKLSGGEWSPEYQVITDSALELTQHVMNYGDIATVYLNDAELTNVSQFILETFHDSPFVIKMYTKGRTLDF